MPTATDYQSPLAACLLGLGNPPPPPREGPGEEGDADTGHVRGGFAHIATTGGRTSITGLWAGVPPLLQHSRFDFWFRVLVEWKIALFLQISNATKQSELFAKTINSGHKVLFCRKKKLQKILIFSCVPFSKNIAGLFFFCPQPPPPPFSDLNPLVLHGASLFLVASLASL